MQQFSFSPGPQSFQFGHLAEYTRAPSTLANIFSPNTGEVGKGEGISAIQYGSMDLNWGVVRLDMTCWLLERTVSSETTVSGENAVDTF